MGASMKKRSTLFVSVLLLLVGLLWLLVITVSGFLYVFFFINICGVEVNVYLP